MIRADIVTAPLDLKIQIGALLHVHIMHSRAAQVCRGSATPILAGITTRMKRAWMVLFLCLNDDHSPFANVHHLEEHIRSTPNPNADAPVNAGPAWRWRLCALGFTPFGCTGKQISGRGAGGWPGRGLVWWGWLFVSPFWVVVEQGIGPALTYAFRHISAGRTRQALLTSAASAMMMSGSRAWGSAEGHQPTLRQEIS